MDTFKMKRVSIFIYGNNFYFGLRKIYGESTVLKKFNFEKFVNFLVEENELVKVFYYNALLDKERDFYKFKNQKEFFNRLNRIPKFNVVLCKLLKRKFDDNKFYYIIKEDDINMAVDMVEGACDNEYDLAILVSGDGDFVPAVRSVKRKGKSVKNVYFKNSSSKNLKSFCNESLELNKEILDDFL